MKKDEIFDAILDKTAEVCRVPVEAILGDSKFQPFVDARVMAVQYLRRVGMSPDDIALLVLARQSGEADALPAQTEIRKKAKVVSKLFNSYSLHCLGSNAFCLMSEELAEFCRERFMVSTMQRR